MADPFISRQDLTDYLGKDVTADDGALAAVDAACDMVRTLSGQDFNAGTSTVVLDGPGTDALVLPQLPVSNVGTVELVSNSGTTEVTDYILSEDGCLFRTAGVAPDGWPAGVHWPIGRQNVRVTYEHGYDAVDIPRDVRFVALSIASRLIVQGVAIQENQGQVGIRYGTNATDYTAGERAILHKYRQIG